MNLKRRALCAAAAALLCLGNVSYAQSAYPNKPIRIIVPYPAGSGGDNVLQRLGESLQKSMGQLEAPAKVRTLRKDLARIKTILREKQTAAGRQ